MFTFFPAGKDTSNAAQAMGGALWSQVFGVGVVTRLIVITFSLTRTWISWISG